MQDINAKEVACARAMRDSCQAGGTASSQAFAVLAFWQAYAGGREAVAELSQGHHWAALLRLDMDLYPDTKRRVQEISRILIEREVITHTRDAVMQLAT